MSIATEQHDGGFSLVVPPGVGTLQGFVAWSHGPDFPRHGKISFLDGELDIDMCPEELLSHNLPKADLIEQLSAYVRTQRLGRVFVDGAQIVNAAANLACEPDLLLCTYESLKSGRAALQEGVEGSGRMMQIVGAPDLVVEIVSRSSVGKDTKRLRTLYFQAGIPEYWIIDARRERLKIAVLSASKDGYEESPPDGGGYVRSLVLGDAFCLERTLDEAGLPQYSFRWRSQTAK